MGVSQGKNEGFWQQGDIYHFVDLEASRFLLFPGTETTTEQHCTVWWREAINRPKCLYLSSLGPTEARAVTLEYWHWSSLQPIHSLYFHAPVFSPAALSLPKSWRKGCEQQLFLLLILELICLRTPKGPPSNNFLPCWDFSNSIRFFSKKHF